MSGTRRVFETTWFSIDELTQSDGSPFYRLTRPDGVVVLPLMRDGRMVLVRQHRPARGRLSIEMPGGSVDPGEMPLEAARRELLEEAGFGGGDWVFLGTGGMSLDRDSATMHLFLARGVEQVGAPEPNIEVMLRPVGDLRDLVFSGQCEHLGALAALVMMRWRGLGDLLEEIKVT